MQLEQCLQAGFVPILHFVQKGGSRSQRPSALWPWDESGVLQRC